MNQQIYGQITGSVSGDSFGNGRMCLLVKDNQGLYFSLVVFVKIARRRRGVKTDKQFHSQHTHREREMDKKRQNIFIQEEHLHNNFKLVIKQKKNYLAFATSELGDL